MYIHTGWSPRGPVLAGPEDRPVIMCVCIYIYIYIYIYIAVFDVFV